MRNIPLNTRDPSPGQNLEEIERTVNAGLRGVSIDGAEGRDVTISLRQSGNTLRVMSSRAVTDRGREQVFEKILPLLGSIVFDQGIHVLGWMPETHAYDFKACHAEHGGFNGK